MFKISSHTIVKTLGLGFILLIPFLLSGCSGGSFMASSWPGFSIDQDIAYVANGPAIYAIDLSNGREIWHFPEDLDRSVNLFAPPASSSEDLIIVGGYNNLVYALDPEKGDQAWPQPFDEASDRIIGSPVVAGDIVLVPSADGRLYALDLARGVAVWRQPFQAGEDPSPLWSAPLVDGERLYLASLDHHVYAINLTNGEEIWRSRDLGAAIADTPTLADGLILVGTFGKALFAIDVRTGEVQWSVETEGWVWGNPAVADGRAYFGDTSGTAYAIDLDRGREVWSENLIGAIAATPAIGNGGVFFVTETGNVYAFETDSGEPLWLTNPTLEGKLLSDPIIHGETLLAGTMSPDCLILEIETQSGAVRCIFKPSES